MREIIKNKLKEIEEEYDVSIPLAVESGSRAWGFESTDSDYDVRFIYIRKEEEYLKLERTRDVIELPINDALDISGWDISKTLRLLYKSNPTLYEWFASPVIYYRDEDFCKRIRPYLSAYFLPRNSVYHYLNMAKNNYREIRQSEVVKVKKYFYVLRPVLACRWVLEKKTAPPMRFKELVKEELPEELMSEVSRLLDLKMNSPEIRKISAVTVLNHYLDESIDALADEILSMSEKRQNEWGPLNELFLTLIRQPKML